MLGGDDDVLERDGGVTVVAEGELGLPVWAEVVELTGLADLAEPLGHP
ncbi:Uncharacterised protein [Mycobacteroides abscessus subsp. abscessus]|nr:Uncharacterised protein [Mycobacteroides abscessus subsp. abscessus]